MPSVPDIKLTRTDEIFQLLPYSYTKANDEYKKNSVNNMYRNIVVSIGIERDADCYEE